MLKLVDLTADFKFNVQPPSGGCVLKQEVEPESEPLLEPAAFRRLCVETMAYECSRCRIANQPPSGGCVLKQFHMFY